MNSPSFVKFWGVRGSVPAPLTSDDVRGKIATALREFAAGDQRAVEPFLERFAKRNCFTYGGNTACVEVRFGNRIIALDMGTGLRPFGNSLFKEMLANRGLEVTFVLSHVHWDHIQGLPFFGPLYLNKESGVRNHWHFFGGTDWQKNGEMCLRGQMDPPTFPVSWGEIQKITHRIDFTDVYDAMSHELGANAKLKFRKLNHPQETYGSRIETPEGKVIVYATDNEPYDPSVPDPRLIDLARDADIFIVDCQYTREIYNGERGVPRHGWGHSYPESVAATALKAKVKKMLLFHHDPMSSDDMIAGIADHTQELIRQAGGATEVAAAYEGLRIDL